MKSERADALLAELRELTGEGITECVVESLEQRLHRAKAEASRSQADLVWHLGQIQAKYAHLASKADEPTDDELMYDSEGLPA